MAGSYGIFVASMKLPRIVAVPALRASEYLFGKFGFHLQDSKPPNPTIKDAEFYRPMFSPWLMPEWTKRLHAEDPRSLVPLHAKYLLYCMALDSSRRCSGAVAECGVYKGGTARILAESLPQRCVYLFDTFAGMPETDPARDLHKSGDFADTSIASVREYLSGLTNVNLVPGLIPDSLRAARDCSFCFVHIDLDIYTAIRSACEFFYPRMGPGGTILFDDYGYSSCPGARAAVDEFFSDKPEVITVMATGQCSVQKLPDAMVAQSVTQAEDAGA